jgi:hypothetical protein
MQRTLSEHLTYLERRIEALKKQLEEPGKSPAEQNEIKIDLGIAERSLVHFRKAYALEQKLTRTVSSFKASPGSSPGN